MTHPTITKDPIEDAIRAIEAHKQSDYGRSPNHITCDPQSYRDLMSLAQYWAANLSDIKFDGCTLSMNEQVSGFHASLKR
jgi:hypothetical protein